MNDYLSNVKEKLNFIISDMANHHWLFANRPGHDFMQFRVIKMKVAEDSYEYIITNLPYSFDLEDLKTCYHWRWQIEVAFRYLKHANGLLYFHSKKPEYLKQEIYVNLILYNFGVFLANKAIQENQKKKHRIMDILSL